MKNTHDGTELLWALCPFGYLNIRIAEQILIDSGVWINDFADYLEKFVHDTGIKFRDLDLCGLVYEYLLQEARTEIEEATGKDICNETEIYLYRSFVCSYYGKTSGALEIALKIPESDRSQLLDWFIDQIR